MCEKIRNFWNGLDVTVKVNKRELVLELAVCALAGLAAGMLLSPRKSVRIGCDNGITEQISGAADPEEYEEDEAVTDGEA